MKKIALIIVSIFMFAGSAVAGNKITLGTVDWAPYYSASAKNGGPVTEIATAAFKKVGYDLEVKFMDWNRAVALATEGKNDGILGAYVSEERKVVLGFSEPIGKVSVVLLAKKADKMSYTTMEDLKPYKIGTIRGNVYTKEFDSASYLKKDAVDKLELNIKKLLKGRLDVVIGSKMVLQDAMNSTAAEEADKLEILEPSLSANTLHVAVSKKHPDYKKLVEDFNRGLKMIQDDGTLKSIMTSHGF